MSEKYIPLSLFMTDLQGCISFLSKATIMASFSKDNIILLHFFFSFLKSKKKIFFLDLSG